MSHPIKICSHPCAPYVLGYSMNLEQTRQVASRLCTSEQLALVPDRPDFALNRYFRVEEIQEVILTYKERDRLKYYLWVKGVFPSFDFKKPTVVVPVVDYEKYPALKDIGYVKRRCIMWPIHIAVPMWFYPRLTVFTKFQMEKKKAREREEAADGVHGVATVPRVFPR